MEQTREEAACAAMLLAYANSCKRSETRQKWTMNDQRTHERLKEALLLFMDADNLETSVMQIRGIGLICEQPQVA
jgi:hypothetical protein